MQPDRRTPASAPRSIDAQVDTGPALRDARAIAERIAADEHAADEARLRYRDQGLPQEEDPALVGIIEQAERLHAIHTMALVEPGGSGSGPHPAPRGGRLYLTSHRLIHRGVEDAEWRLDDVVEMAVALERILLIQLRDGSDLTIEVEQPRLLRVQVAAAIAHRRDESSADEG